MRKKGFSNVRQRYYQTVLAGWGDNGEPAHKDSDSIKGKQATPEQAPYDWKQKSNQLLIPVKLTQVSIHGNEHKYSLSIPTNVDVSISPVSATGKVLTKQAGYLAKASARDNSKVLMVFRVSEDGKVALSPTSEHPLQSILAYVFSRVLEQANRAIECSILNSSREEASTNDAGQRQEITPGKGSMGRPKKPRRGEKIRTEIRTEDTPEAPAGLVETDGALLGNGQGNREDQLERV